jgi:hypothetical protein
MIMSTRLKSAVRSTGRDFIALDWESDPRDTTLYIRQEKGYGTMEYAQSPQKAEFRAALAEQEGGEEAGNNVCAEWTSHIDNSSTGVAQHCRTLFCFVVSLDKKFGG